MKLYHYQTKQGYEVKRLYLDLADDYATAIIKTPNEFIIARGYNQDTGTWNQGYYGYVSEDNAIYCMHKIFMDIVSWKPLYTIEKGYYCD